MSPVAARVTIVGTMTDPRLPEVSGLAASRAHPGLLWVENDSGNPADVYLVGTGGQVSAREDLTIAGLLHVPELLDRHRPGAAS